jgi:hypothetical protein
MRTGASSFILLALQALPLRLERGKPVAQA